MDLSNVLYFAIELDEDSKNKLIEFSKTKKLPENWNPRFFCHHMTIAFRTQFQSNPELIKWCEEHMGEEFYLAGLNFGISDKAMAIRVGTKVPSANELKHVTIATNTNTGGKPVDSNSITNWKQCQTIVLKGKIKAFFR